VLFHLSSDGFPISSARTAALVALDHVARLRPLPSGGYVAILHDGREVPVSRQAARALRRRLAL
jgi:two-component system LytT family response regulator